MSAESGPGTIVPENELQKKSVEARLAFINLIQVES